MKQILMLLVLTVPVICLAVIYAASALRGRRMLTGVLALVLAVPAIAISGAIFTALPVSMLLAAATPTRIE